MGSKIKIWMFLTKLKPQREKKTMKNNKKVAVLGLVLLVTSVLSAHAADKYTGDAHDKGRGVAYPVQGDSINRIAYNAGKKAPKQKAFEKAKTFIKTKGFKINPGHSVARETARFVTFNVFLTALKKGKSGKYATEHAQIKVEK